MTARQPARRSLIIAIIAAVAAIIVILYALVDPESGFFPRCSFLMLTGLQCPGCGSQRAFHALLHGDIAAAWRYNAMLFFFVPLIALMLFAEWQHKRWPRLSAALTSPAFICLILTVLTLWTIFRNLCTTN